MSSRRRKNAAKKDTVRGFVSGDIVGVNKAARGNTGPVWLQATILSDAPGGFFDFEVEYQNPSILPGGTPLNRFCRTGEPSQTPGRVTAPKLHCMKAFHNLEMAHDFWEVVFILRTYCTSPCHAHNFKPTGQQSIRVFSM